MFDYHCHPVYLAYCISQVLCITVWKFASKINRAITSSPLCRSVSGSLLHSAGGDRDSPLLPGASSGPAHPTGQYRGVELHQSTPGWHRLRQLFGEYQCFHIDIRYFKCTV